MRRSSCSFGRMEIRSSSEDSQFIMFNIRFRFPLKRRNAFAAQRELPTTTNRPWLFGLPVLYVAAAASVNGPFLSLLASMRISGELRLVVAKLLAEVEKSLVTDVLSPFLVSSDRDIGKPVAVPE